MHSKGPYFSIVLYSRFLYERYSNSSTKLILAWVRMVVQVNLHPLRGPVIPSPLLYSPRGPEMQRSTEFNSTYLITTGCMSCASILHYKIGGQPVFLGPDLLVLLHLLALSHCRWDGLGVENLQCRRSRLAVEFVCARVLRNLRSKS